MLHHCCCHFYYLVDFMPSYYGYQCNVTFKCTLLGTYFAVVYMSSYTSAMFDAFGTKLCFCTRFWSLAVKHSVQLPWKEAVLADHFSAILLCVGRNSTEVFQWSAICQTCLYGVSMDRWGRISFLAFWSFSIGTWNPLEVSKTLFGDIFVLKVALLKVMDLPLWMN